MYSHEIKQLLELKNYLLDRKEANKILNINIFFKGFNKLKLR